MRHKYKLDTSARWSKGQSIGRHRARGRRKSSAFERFQAPEVVVSPLYAASCHLLTIGSSVWHYKSCGLKETSKAIDGCPFSKVCECAKQALLVSP